MAVNPDRRDRARVTDFILRDFLPYQLVVTANRISDRFSDSYRERFGITVSEWRVIAHLSQGDGLSIREIYRKVEMDKSKASRAAARLVKAGYVRKKVNPTDRRLVELSLTDKGRAMMAEIGPMSEEFEREVLALLPEEERAPFLSAVRRLMDQYT